MPKLLYCACTALLCAATVSPCLAANSPWNGTWKLNNAKSNFTGDTFSITMKDDGAFRYSDGPITYDFACNGTAYPTFANRTITCTGGVQRGYTFTMKAGSTVLSKSYRVISPDGKTMTVQNTTTNPDGSTSMYQETYKRVGETSGSKSTLGIAAKWKNVSAKETGTHTMVLAVNGNMINVQYPESQENISGKMDGSDLKVSGPNIPAGAYETFKTEGANKLHFTIKYKDKVLEEGDETLGPDDKTLTMQEWLPGQTANKKTLIYDKQ